MKESIIIIGAGGHGKVVCEAIEAQGMFNIIGFADSSVEIGTTIIKDYKVVIGQSNLNQLKNKVDYFIVAVGNNFIRDKVFSELKALFKPATVIHPKAYIGLNVTIGEGSVILANSLIGTTCSVGKNVIVNSGVIIDHDSIIGSHVHLSIGTHVGSNSEIGDSVTTQIGQNIMSFSKVVC
jgi:sugar O-acyltransferase (sialic acid O-acetyltransferase NeuD family)